MDTTNIIVVVLSLIFGVARYLYDQRQKQQQMPPPAPRSPAPPVPKEDEDDWDEDDWNSAAQPAPQPVVADPYAKERRELGDSLGRLVTDAEALLTVARAERANWRLAAVMNEYVVARAKALRGVIAGGRGRILLDENMGVNHLDMVYGSVREFIEQRRTPGLREALGDVDAMARACYEPVFGFARANNIPLSSAEPVAVLAPFELSTWTGFIPTGIAPLFLPERLLTDVRWWPAIAHEIGHDVLAASAGVEERLRDEMGLPPEEIGVRPLRMFGGRLEYGEVIRVFGGFFEEMFCDVFGTMMLGPAYGYTMVELFAIPHAPRLTRRVGVSAQGSYDIHPPRLMRVLLGAHVLRLMGEDEAAEDMLATWRDVHGDDGAVVFPVVGGEVAVPAGALDGILGEMAEKLYSRGLDALDGHCLADVPGLEYGPHRAAEARRARDELLRGKVPSQHPPRAVVAGAVLAWRQAPERNAAIAVLARRAIVGVTEVREDGYSAGRENVAGRAGSLREAFFLHTILAPPRSARWRRGSGGFLALRDGRVRGH